MNFQHLVFKFGTKKKLKNSKHAVSSQKVK